MMKNRMLPPPRPRRRQRLPTEILESIVVLISPVSEAFHVATALRLSIAQTISPFWPVPVGGILAFVVRQQFEQLRWWATKTCRFELTWPSIFPSCRDDNTLAGFY